MVATGDTLFFRAGGAESIPGVVRYIGPITEDASRAEWLGIE